MHPLRHKRVQFVFTYLHRTCVSWSDIFLIRGDQWNILKIKNQANQMTRASNHCRVRLPCGQYVFPFLELRYPLRFSYLFPRVSQSCRAIWNTSIRIISQRQALLASSLPSRFIVKSQTNEAVLTKADMIATAPLYTGRKVRTHSTQIGRILCTGKGCIGCGAKRFENKSIAELLGDIDTVDFSKQRSYFGIRHGSVFASRPVTAPGCYGNDERDGSFSAKAEYRGKKKASRKGSNTENKTLIPKGFENGRTGKKCFKTKRISSSVLAAGGFESLQQESKKDKQGTTPSISPSRQHSLGKDNSLNTLRAIRSNLPNTKKHGKDLEAESGTIKNTFTVNQPRSSPDMPKNNNGRIQARTTIQKPNRAAPVPHSKSKTNYLEMLQKSEAGIYDVKIMEERKESKWVTQILREGVSEKELLPRIPSAKLAIAKAAETKNASRGTRGDCKQGRGKMPNLPRITLNDYFLYQGEDTVIVIEHDHDGTTKVDESLHQLSFAVERSLVRRFLPRISVLDIAEGLGELVSMKSIQVIQRKGGRWHILVKGNSVKDFLVQNGVVVKGRRLYLVDNTASVKDV